MQFHGVCIFSTIQKKYMEVHVIFFCVYELIVSIFTTVIGRKPTKMGNCLKIKEEREKKRQHILYSCLIWKIQATLLGLVS